MNKRMLETAIRQYTSPCYLFDLDAFSERYRKIQDLLGKNKQISLCFAMKANPFLVRRAAKLGTSIEVCSPGEFAICERNGISMKQIVLSGVYKEPGEIRRVLETYGGDGIYTAESIGQYQLLARLAKNGRLKLRILLRLTAGNQFGMDEETIKELIANREQYPQLQIQGIQYYSGTQKKRKQLLEKELRALDDFLGVLKTEYGYQAEKLEYGPGFYVPYFMQEEPEEMEDFLHDFGSLLSSLSFGGTITLEMGRYLAASCGYYLTKIVEEKENHQNRYVIVDGGIHQLHYYGQMMAMKIPYYHQFSDCGQEKRLTEAAVPVTVCGALCTVNDVLAKHVPLMEPAKDDLLVFENAGAYSMTESMSLFLSRDLPQIYGWSGKEGLRLMRDRVESNLWNGE